MLYVYEAENVILPKIELHKFIFVYGIDDTILIVSSETTLKFPSTDAKLYYNVIKLTYYRSRCSGEW